MSECEIEDCHRPLFCRRLCRAHYRRLQRYGDPLKGGAYQEYHNKGHVCRAPNCDKPAVNKGLCSMHTQRWTAHHDLTYTGPRDHRFLEHQYTYKVWDGMKQRCCNPNASGYGNYGGRGIKICNRWLGRKGFLNFLKDMGERPKGYSIDRIDVNGDYCPENCRWVTALVQNCNRRNNLPIPGVRYTPKNPNKKWVASITIRGKRYYKSFANKADAVTQRRKWEELWG